MSDYLVLDIEHLEAARHGDGAKALREAVEDVIAGGANLRDHFIGTKNYEGWSNQGIGWTKYGMRPSHGSVWLRIGLTPGARGAMEARGDHLLTADERRTALAQLGYEPEGIAVLYNAEVEASERVATAARSALERVLCAGVARESRQRAEQELREALASHRNHAQHAASLHEARMQAAKALTVAS